MRKGIRRKPWEGQYIKDYLGNLNVLKIADPINLAYCAIKNQHQ